jgi:hypothetical protein
MPEDTGNTKPHLRVSYNPITDDLTMNVVNQILALLTRADTLLHSISSSPDLNTQPLSAFFSQLNRALWGVLVTREGLPVGKASDPTTLQGSAKLKGLSRQVQAINSRLGAIQAQLQKSPK